MRLGDLDVLREELQSMRVTLGGKDIYPGATKLSVLQRIDEQPTIDAVPVVRCEKCLHWDNSQYANRTIGLCNSVRRRRGARDFCSYGERKEG